MTQKTTKNDLFLQLPALTLHKIVQPLNILELK